MTELSNLHHLSYSFGNPKPSGINLNLQKSESSGKLGHVLQFLPSTNAS